MAAQIIDGKKISEDIRREVKEATQHLQTQRGFVPGLAFILVGDNPASQSYVRMKGKACEEVGFYSVTERMPTETPQDVLLRKVDEFNVDPRIHGILVQLPLPKHIDEHTVIERINPQKDVDGFHPYNVGRLVAGNPLHSSCTPYGIMELFDRNGIELSGKEAVVVGRSNIVGKPMALMLLARHATVTICHTRTRNLAEVTRRADVLVAAAGRAQMIKGDMVKDGVVVIDVGTNRLDNGKLVGDVDFAAVSQKASYITPVPGGVGPMTRAMLMKNTLDAARRSINS